MHLVSEKSRKTAAIRRRPPRSRRSVRSSATCAIPPSWWMAHCPPILRAESSWAPRSSSRGKLPKAIAACDLSRVASIKMAAVF